MLVLRVRAEQAVQVLGRRPRTRALVLATMHEALLIGKLSAAAGLLATGPATLLREQLVALLQVLRADGLRIREALFLLALVAVLGGRAPIIDVEHVLNVLRLILRSVTVRLLLVRQLDWPSTIKELRGAVGRHILELNSTVEAAAHDLLVSAHARRAVAGLELAIGEDLAVEEGHVVGAGA